MTILNRDLFDKAKEIKFTNPTLLVKFVIEQQNLEDSHLDDAKNKLILSAIDKFLKNAQKKWRDVAYSQDRMEKKYGDWLSHEASLPQVLQTKKSGTSSSGRPSKDFMELGKRARDKSTEALREENETQKLIHATKIALKKDGAHDFVFLMNEATKTPTRASKLRRISGIAENMDSVPSSDVSLPSLVSPLEALAFLFQNNMTTSSYTNMRLFSKDHGANIWPSYNEVLESKKLCRPENIVYTETTVIVPLTDRLKHNDQSLIEICDEEIKSLLLKVEDQGIIELIAESKIGFDGASGQSIYNQAFSLQNKDTQESSLLSTCLVPLQYKTVNGKVLFQNPVPQSSSFCQPVRIEFRKETVNVSQEINAWINDELKNMDSHTIEVNIQEPPSKKFIKISHTVRKTMLDNKAKNALTETVSAQTCFLCHAKPTDFNKLTNFHSVFPTDKNNLQYGAVCDLHIWPRSFDAINSVSDKLTTKKWRKSKEEKEEIEKRKKVRQARFREELGLLVDVPRAGGAGNSNNGNTARRAFQNEEKFSEITGVSKELIHQIHMMLIILNSDHPIDKEKFKKYGEETAALWVSLYPWYYMPVSIHQLFLHAWESLEFSSLPLSFYSEQSLESSHKEFKYDRLHHSRHDSRINTITDQFNRQNDKTDLVVALQIQKLRSQRQKQLELPADAVALFIPESKDGEEEDE